MSSTTKTINRDKEGHAKTVTVDVKRDDGSEKKTTYEATFPIFGGVEPGRKISETDTKK